MKKRIYVVAVIGLAAAAGAYLWMNRSPFPPLEKQLAMFDSYCVDCHNEAEFAGGLSLEHMRAGDLHDDAALWEQIVRKLRVGAMPPKDVDHRPEEQQVAALIATVESSLDEAFADHPTPPSPVIHRLNRTEYSNAVRDLLAIDVDASEYLPPDNVVEGFDNIAEALTISPALLEGYLSASAKVASLAIGDPDRRAETVTYRTKPDQSQNERVDGAPLGTIGGLVVEHYFPLDGKYRFEPRLYRQILASVRGLEFPRALEVSIDKERVHYAEFGGPDDQKRSNEENAFAMAEEIDARLAFEQEVSAGPHTVAVTFLRKPPALSADLWREYRRQLIDSNEDKGFPHLDQVDITGPIEATGVGSTPSRRKIFTCRPEAPADEKLCANDILSGLARRAYRRPVTEGEVAELMSFYDMGRRAQGSFDKGIETGIRRILSGPEFIFRAESDPDGVAPGTSYRVSDLELASRLSFFLWSSIPDDELLDLAIRRELSDPATFEAQVRRMLADEKSSAFVDNFVGQWLTIRNLEGIVPDPAVFPDFDNNLRQALFRETELFFNSIVREDHSVLDILDADYTFMNERLARHYGVRNVYGERFQRVHITDPARRGILGQASIQTLTSVATRTSPVTRGKWILTNILGMPAPVPPPNVPSIEASATGKPQTLREQMTRHRADPVCAACHQVLDPFGFALENFDAVGQWRETDQGIEINTADTLLDGTPVDGVEDLREFLLSKKYLFVQTLTEKLMTYALGRSIDVADMPVIRQVLRSSAENDYRFSSIVSGIVNSAAFQMRTATPDAEGQLSVAAARGE